MDINDHLRAGGEDEVRKLFDAAWLKRRTALDEAQAVFRKWLSDSYDTAILHAIVAARVSHDLAGIPLWLLVVSGSGAAKTESVTSLRETGVHIESTIASEGALLSASPKKSHARTATGGLLRKIGDSGVVVIKDVTTILSMPSVARAPMLAALREIHDGKWTRNVGTDGGQTLDWEGRVTVIGAVTSAWDEHHGVIAMMGDRFALMRFDSNDYRSETGLQAIMNGSYETHMRDEMARAVKAVVDAADYADISLADAEMRTLVAIADAVTFIRTAVVVDYRGDIVDAHLPEAPTRFAKQLAQLFKGALAIGMSREDAMKLVARCGHDTAPPSRLSVLIDVEANPGTNITASAKRLGRPRNTVRRWFHALLILGLLTSRELADGSDGYWIGKRLNRVGFALITKSGGVR
ncbi:ArsR family transcriptional regulator [Rhizobium sp. BR 362]|uniref:ArsR family transcriptional regulator n=1 Tax=Rhizobium sp. BR 362 TaxID=3040670 RepID=UPI002F418169